MAFSHAVFKSVPREVLAICRLAANVDLKLSAQMDHVVSLHFFLPGLASLAVCWGGKWRPEFEVNVFP
jgi:hypothetical protein